MTAKDGSSSVAKLWFVDDDDDDGGDRQRV